MFLPAPSPLAFPSPQHKAAVEAAQHWDGIEVTGDAQPPEMMVVGGDAPMAGAEWAASGR